MNLEPTYPAWSRPLKHVSVSQISKLLSCQRLWALQYGLGIFPPSGPGAALGDKLHKEMEGWLRDGQAPVSGPSLTAIRHWPTRQPGLQIEVPIHLELATIIPDAPELYGRVDVLIDLPPPLAGPLQMIGDHKFVKSLQYAKSVRELEQDLQACMYAYWARCPPSRGGLGWDGPVWVKWVFTETTKQATGSHRSIPIETQIEDEMIEAQFARFANGVRLAMQYHEQKPNPDEVPSCMDTSDGSHCDAYGGCVFRQRCAGAQTMPIASPGKKPAASFFGKAAPAAAAPTASPEVPAGQSLFDTYAQPDTKLPDPTPAKVAPVAVPVALPPPAVNPPEAELPPPAAPVVEEAPKKARKGALRPATPAPEAIDLTKAPADAGAVVEPALVFTADELATLTAALKILAAAIKRV